MKSAEAYYLAWPADRAKHAPLMAFRKWILDEIRED
jgi:LysR family glycine cleavage system transcriptional activator